MENISIFLSRGLLSSRFGLREKMLEANVQTSEPKEAMETERPHPAHLLEEETEAQGGSRTCPRSRADGAQWGCSVTPHRGQRNFHELPRWSFEMWGVWMCRGWKEASVSHGVTVMPRLSAAKAAGAKTGADGVVRGPPLGLPLAQKQGWVRRQHLVIKCPSPGRGHHGSRKGPDPPLSTGHSVHPTTSILSLRYRICAAPSTGDCERFQNRHHPPGSAVT